MKTDKKTSIKQRQIIERKLAPWVSLRKESKPPAGWLKAIRGSLGITTRQLAEYLNVTHSTIIELEKRESKGKASFEVLNRVASAMDCKLVYAIVPNDFYSSLEEIVDKHARQAAEQILKKVEHTMRLEAQGTSNKDSEKQLEQLTQELKSTMDSRMWDKKIKVKEKKQKPK